MGKALPKLHLVNKDGQSLSSGGLGIAEGLDFFSLDELSKAEAKQVERLIEAVCPRAGLIAVARSVRPWDCRPVVALTDEEGPSIIRSAGPDVSLNTNISAKLFETLERIARFKDISSGMLDWGVFDEQVWYRRTLFDKTFAHLISGTIELEAKDLLLVIGNIVDELNAWHAHGIVHGHLVTSNIFVRGDVGVSLLDASISAAVTLSSRDISATMLQNLAPEIASGLPPSYPTDIYGLGQMIRRLGVVLRKKYQFSGEKLEVEQIFGPYLRLTQTMLDSKPEKRPNIREVAASIKDIKQNKELQENFEVSTSGGKYVKSVSQGHVVRSGSSNLETRENRVNGSGEASAKEKDRESVSDVGGEEFPIEWEFDNELVAEQVFSVHQDALVETSTGVPKKQESKEQEKIDPPVNQNRPGGSFWSYLFLFSCLFIGLFVYLRQVSTVSFFDDYSIEEIRFAWESKVPSRMLPVVEAAISAETPSRLAQDVIIGSANRGDELPKEIDIALLRVAFSSKWEAELDDQDRRMAIALGALGLLRDRMPRDLGSLSARHPAVILAVTATAGENVTNKILRKISAETLIHLQPPYGPAFRKLLANRSNVSCGDETVQLLARFGTRGLDQKQDLPRFLSGKDSSQNLQALAILYATDNVLARTFLEVLLKHPNMVIDNSYIQWGKDWDISAWSEIEPGDQLFVLSGIPPAGSVKIENVGKMFKHPSPVIRRYAIQQALDRIKFQHPGAFEAMSTLMKNPEMLSAEQLFKLAELLETPKNVTEERVRAWLESQPSPPVDLIAPLLLKTYQEKLGTKLDTWFAVYLKTKGWMPDIVSLRKLAQHPDQYTRLFAYDQIFKLKDESSAAAMLAAALVGEQEPSNRQQLEQMIAQLKR